MGRGLSNQQKEILRILVSMDGDRYYWGKFLDKVKATLYPDLWYDFAGHGCKVREYGLNQEEKNSARVSITKAINRLEKRGLIEFKNPEGHRGTVRIYITLRGDATLMMYLNEIHRINWDQGRIMGKEVPQCIFISR